MRNRQTLLATVLVLTLGLPTSLLASDHIDGPVTIDNPVADITDLYAFPSRDRPGNLTLILDVYPMVAYDGHFSDRVTYNLLVRQASISRTKSEAGFEAKGDYRVSCTFETPHDSPHWVTCKASSGSSVRAQINDTSGGESTHGLRVFAGSRSDPFFFNRDWAKSASEEGVLLPPEDNDIMERMNVLSIVLDLDITAELEQGASPLLAIAAETTTRTETGGTRRIDRVGRPEITNVSMAPHGGRELRDLYNQEAPFDISSETIDLYRSRLRDNVVFYDKMDGRRDWTSARGAVLVEILLHDFLLVDVSKPDPGNSYFGIEKSVLSGEPHSTYGGRAPQDDVMDTLFTLFINGGHGPEVSDGVDEPTRPAKEAFPYLAAPDDRLLSTVKAHIARLMLKYAP
jgi:hypothetical protein